jgi:competence protein ComEA
MLVLLLVVVAALYTREFWQPAAPPGAVVEVVGDVPYPGMYALEHPTVASAIEAAGGDHSAAPVTPVHSGDRVVVRPDGVHIAPAGQPLLVALPVDVNTADSEALAAIPGVGPKLAEKIVAGRGVGPYRSLDELDRVQGIAPHKVAEIAPFATVGIVQAPLVPVLVDLNTASAAELERLPGIGPVTSARIIVDRDENGAFADLADLERVSGIGPATAAALAEHVTQGAGVREATSAGEK